MKKVKRALSTVPVGWRVPLSVALVHLLAILSAILLRLSDPPPVPPEGVRVALAALPMNAQVPTKAKPSAPAEPAKATATQPKPLKPVKKAWKARSAEDIRRELESQTKTPLPTKAVDTPSAPDANLQELVDDFTKAAHATTVIGEPVAVPDNYAAKIRQVIYDTWKQPTKAEVPVASQFVGIRLEIQSDGRVSAGTITQRSKSLIMNQSVKSLLNALKKLPPLPESYAEDQLRLDIVLRLE